MKDLRHLPFLLSRSSFHHEEAANIDLDKATSIVVSIMKRENDNSCFPLQVCFLLDAESFQVCFSWFPNMMDVNTAQRLCRCSGKGKVGRFAVYRRE